MYGLIYNKKNQSEKTAQYRDIYIYIYIGYIYRIYIYRIYTGNYLLF